MTEPVGLALVGTGRWGGRPADAVGRTDKSKLVTCFSRLQERYGTEATSDGQTRREYIQRVLKNSIACSAAVRLSGNGRVSADR